MTFLAALRSDRIEAHWVFDGPINGDSFRVYVEKVLIPALTPGDVVVLDNLGSRKGQEVRAPPCERPARMSYFCRPIVPISIQSRRSSRIERVFAKLKHLLRQAAERTVKAVWSRIGTIFDQFTPRECANYLAKSRYVAMRRHHALASDH